MLNTYEYNMRNMSILAHEQLPLTPCVHCPGHWTDCILPTPSLPQKDSTPSIQPGGFQLGNPGEGRLLNVVNVTSGENLFLCGMNIPICFNMQTYGS